MNISNLTKALFGFVIALLFVSCGGDQAVSTTEDFSIKIGLKGDPERLNPMLSSGAINRQVFQYIFLPIADYDPINLELVPILVKEVPKPVKITEGKYVGGLSYQYEILPDALWSDGTAITAADYAFTVKAVMHPGVQASKWRNYVKEIVAINIDASNTKKFEVIVGREFILATEVTTTLQMYPAHVYDPSSSLLNVTLDQLKDEQWYTDTTAKDSSLVVFADAMNSNKYSREIVVGAGPYQLKDWKTNQYVVLDKIADYWGEAYPENVFLQAFANRLEFQIIADETSALSLLKSGKLDVLPNISSVGFDGLQNDEKYANEFDFLSPQIMRYYYLLLNNRNPKLDDKNVRRALAHVVDVDEIIKNLEFGNASPTVGPIHPSKSYYNKNLNLIKFDIGKSQELLKASGWSDSNDNGVVDKMIDGKSTELELTIMISGSELGKKVALITQQNAIKAGIKINIEEILMRPMVKERIRPRNFDMAALVSTQDAAPVDPYSRWHTDLAVANGQNDSGFGSDRSDKLIEEIRQTTDAAKREPLYLELQEIIYDEQPVIFLYSPRERIIVSDRLQSSSSPKRPGYFANTFKLK